MHWFSYGVALLASAGIIVIGIMYLFNPKAIMPNFGLPLPDTGPITMPWLRLKGMRDIVSGLIVLSLVAWGAARMLGIVLAIEALIPLTDMSLVLVGKGNPMRAFLVHGLTAVLMILAAIPLIVGAA